MEIDGLFVAIIGEIGMLGAVSEFVRKWRVIGVETEQTRAVVILESVQQFSLDKLRSDICLESTIFR